VAVTGLVLCGESGGRWLQRACGLVRATLEEDTQRKVPQREQMKEIKARPYQCFDFGDIMVRADKQLIRLDISKDLHYSDIYNLAKQLFYVSPETSRPVYYVQISNQNTGPHCRMMLSHSIRPSKARASSGFWDDFSTSLFLPVCLI
jgi:hypothetical protein